MNTMISNPKQTITINKPASHVLNCLKHLGGWAGNDTGITITQAEIDTNLNRYTFRTTGHGSGIDVFGNLGTAIVNPIDDNRCEITVEVGRAYGCIDEPVDAQICSNDIKSFFNVLSSIINKTDEELQQYPVQKKNSMSAIEWILAIIGGIILGAGIIGFIGL